jgi:hypothetical protein
MSTASAGLHWADEARSEKERSAFLQMPKTWYEVALRLEQSLGLIEILRRIRLCNTHPAANFG